jgi:hypothetical protein
MHSLTSAVDGGEWSAPFPDQLTPREGAPCTHCIGGRVGPRAGLDAVSKSRDGTALGYGINDPRFESRQGLGIFLLTTTSRPALGVHPASYPMGTSGSFPWGKAAEA